MPTFRFPGGALDPFGTLRYMQREMERLVGRGPFGEQRVGGGNFPPVNVYDGRDDLVVQCEVPGVRKDDLDLSITGETLVVKGVKRMPEAEETLDYQRRERGVGDFSRTIVLPDRVEADKIEARLEAGVLTVRLPKAQSARPRQIQVK